MDWLGLQKAHEDGLGRGRSQGQLGIPELLPVCFFQKPVPGTEPAAAARTVYGETK